MEGEISHLNTASDYCQHHYFLVVHNYEVHGSFPRHAHQSYESLVLQREGEFEKREDMKNIKNTRRESKSDVD